MRINGLPVFLVAACLLGRVLPARFTHFLIVLGWTLYFAARTETAIFLSTQSLTAAAIVSGVKFVIFCGVAGMEIRACADRSLHCQGLGLSQDIEAPWCQGGRMLWSSGEKVSNSPSSLLVVSSVCTLCHCRKQFSEV